MGRVFRRILSFILGFVIGIGSVAGTLVGAAYWAYKKVSLKKIGAEIDGFGDLNTMTVEQTIDTALDMFKNPQNYSIADLEDKYGFELDTFLSSFGLELKEESSDDKANVEAMKNMNLAYLFSAGGVSSFLDTLNPRILFNFLPDSFLSDGARARLGQYSLSELIKKDPITGNLGLIDALGQVKFGALFPDYFDEVYVQTTHTYTYEYISSGEDDGKNWLKLVGNLNFGSLLNSFITGKSGILEELMSGRLTDLSDRPIKEVLAEIGDVFPGEIGDVIYQYASMLGDSSISDWFILDEDSAQGYSFSIDNFLREIKVGYAFGYVQAEKVKGEDGTYTYTVIEARDAEQAQAKMRSVQEKEIVWCKNNGTDEDPDFEDASGITGVLADLNVYSIYTAYQNGTLPEVIVDEVSDFSVGSLYEEFLGYRKTDDGEWVTESGDKALSCLTAFADVSVSQVLSEQGSIVDNIINAIKNSVDGYVIGDFVSDFVDFSVNDKGYWVNADGEYLISILDGLFSIEIGELIMDDFSATEIVKILKEAVGESELGELLRYTRVDGVWCDGTEELSEMMQFISDLKFRNVLDIFLTDYSPTQILKAIFGESTVEDVLVAFAKFEYDEEQDIFYNFKGKETVEALSVLRDSKVWELAAAFDKGTAHDVFPVLNQLEIGDFVGRKIEDTDVIIYDEDGKAQTYKYWTLDNFLFDEPVRMTGALNTLLSLNIGQMVDPEIPTETIVEPIKNITVGEIAQSAVGLYQSAVDGETDWVSDYGIKVFDFMRVLANIPTSIQNILEFVDGQQTLEEFLTYMLDHVRVGDFVGDVLGLSYNEELESWLSDEDITAKAYDVIEFLLDYEVINNTYEIINSEEKLQTLAKMVKGLEAGNIVEPFIGIEATVSEIVENEDGTLSIKSEWNSLEGDLYTILKDVYGIDLSYLIKLIDQIIKDEKVLASEVIANISGTTRTVGQYLSEFIPELNFKPIEKNVYDIIIYQFVDIVFENDWLVHDFETKRAYVKYLFESIKVGHFLEPIEAMNLLEDGDIWVKRDDSEEKYYNLYCALYNIKPYFIGEFIVDTVADKTFAYDKLYGEIFGKDTNIGYYLYEFFNHQYSQEKQIWTDSAGYVLYSAVNVAYNTVPYEYLNLARQTSFPQATRDIFGRLLFGDFVYDIVMERFAMLEIKAFKDSQTGLYVNYGEWDNLANTFYNSSIEEIYANYNLRYWKNKFFNLLIGDYLASATRFAVKAIGYNTKITYNKEHNYYFVTEEFNKILSTVFNRTLNNVKGGIERDGFYVYMTENWFRNILVGDFMDYGLYHYNPASELWYDRDEVVPFDFDLMSILKHDVISLSVYDLTHDFDYMTLLDNLFLGNAMALTRYAEFTDPLTGKTVYLDAGRTYTYNKNGKEQKFPYEVYTDGDGNWFYYIASESVEVQLEVEEYMWYDTKLFKSMYGVEALKNEDGTYTIYQTSTGIVYPTEYIAEHDVYKVEINGEYDYFIIYNGTFYQAEPNGDLKRYYKNFIVQKLSDVRLNDMLNGYDIEKMLGSYYVGEVMGNYMGGVDRSAEELDYRQYDTYFWYEDEELTQKLEPLESVVANIKLQAVFDGQINIRKEIEDLKVKDVIQDAEEVSILKLVADKTIADLSKDDTFDEFHIGDIMEYSELKLKQDTEGNFVFPTTVEGASYSHYVRINNNVYPIEIQLDGTTEYYVLNSVRYDLENADIWCGINDIEMIDGYEVKDFKLHDGAGVYIEDITYISDNLFYSNTVGYLVLEDGRWYRSYGIAPGQQVDPRERVFDPTDELVEVFADLTIKEITEGEDFVSDVTDRVKREVHMGKFFTVDENSEGIFALFTQKELDRMLIEDFADESTKKVKEASMQRLLDTKIVNLTDTQQKTLDRAFKDSATPWTEMKINDFVAELIGKVEILYPETTP